MMAGDVDVDFTMKQRVDVHTRASDGSFQRARGEEVQ